MDFVCSPLAFIDGLGGPEMMLIFVIVLLLFGGQKLPEFARGLGKTMREFKKAAAGVEDEFKRALEEDERKKNASQAALAAPATVAPATTHEHDEAYSHSAEDIYAEAGPSAPTANDSTVESPGEPAAETPPASATGDVPPAEEKEKLPPGTPPTGETPKP